MASVTTILATNFVALLAVALAMLIVKCRRAKKIPLPPGPKPWPIIGNIPELLTNKPTYKWIHDTMSQMNTDIACFRFGKLHVIPVTCPEIAQECLKKQDAVLASRPSNSIPSKIFTSGLLTTILAPYGEQWKKMKRVLTSEILSPARHNWLHDKRASEADHLVKYVYNKYLNSENVNVRIASRHYCGNVLRNILFGKRYFGSSMPDGGPGIVEEKYVDAIFTSTTYLIGFSISDCIPSLSKFDLDGHRKLVTEAHTIIRNCHDPLIEERIQKWRNANNDGEKMEINDLLDVFINIKDTGGEPLLTSEEIKAQIAEIMIATIDNPSNVAEWVIAEMLNEPELFLKAVNEIDMVVGKERFVQEHDIPHLKYIKACIKEALRLHPHAAFVPPHVALSDTTVAGYRIPKGSYVMLSRFGLGRNPKVWDEPIKFKPERHLKDQESDVSLVEPNLTFISFSTGRRGCNGMLLGTTMSVILLARLIQGFNWNLPSSISKINLSESNDDLFLNEPLLAKVEPRLPKHLYHSIM